MKTTERIRKEFREERLRYSGTRSRAFTEEEKYDQIRTMEMAEMAELLDRAEELIKAVPYCDEMPAYYMWLEDFKRFQGQE